MDCHNLSSSPTIPAADWSENVPSNTITDNTATNTVHNTIANDQISIGNIENYDNIRNILRGDLSNIWTEPSSIYAPVAQAPTVLKLKRISMDDSEQKGVNLGEVKRKRGRPRKHPKGDISEGPSRKRGRPRKYIPEEESTSVQSGMHSQKEKLKLCRFSTYIEISMFCT